MTDTMLEKEDVTKTLPVMLYKWPNGQCEEVEISFVDPQDRDWFVENEIRISMEELDGPDGPAIVYADCGVHYDDDLDEDPEEVIVFANGRNCFDTLAQLRQECEELLSERKRVRGPGI